MANRDIKPRHRSRAPGVAAILVFLVLAIAFSLFSPVRTLETVRLLADIRSGFALDNSAAEQARDSRETIRYAHAGKDHIADLYQPEKETRAGVVLVPGLAPRGREDPRLVSMARSLARARFTVLVPEIASFRAQEASGGDSHYIAAALCHLGEQMGAGVDDPLGVVALSYAAGPAFIALLQPGNCREAEFLLTVGAYYDLDALITFFTTGYFQEPGSDEWLWAQPNEYGKWAFLKSNAHRATTPQDQLLLAEIAQRKLTDRRALIGDLYTRLGSEGQAVIELLVNEDRQQVEALMPGLPEAIRTDIAALDLKRLPLSNIRARVLLVHGRDDAIIPYSESMALQAAIGEDKAELFLADSLAHVDLMPGSFLDSLVVWRVAYRLLELRDGHN